MAYTDKTYFDYAEMIQDMRRDFISKRDHLAEQMEQLSDYLRLLDNMDDLQTECKKQKEEIESLQQQLADERKQRAELEMKMNEMSKLSAGVAKKSSEEDLLKALRTYVNRSKRKTIDKRAFAKTATLEIANANGLILPEDLAAMIDSLDDELTEPKTTVNVTGNYNDIHDNGGVNLNNKS